MIVVLNRIPRLIWSARPSLLLVYSFRCLTLHVWVNSFKSLITQITIKANYHHLTMLSAISISFTYAAINQSLPLWPPRLLLKITIISYNNLKTMLDADIYMTTISYYYILLTITHRPFKTLLALNHQSKRTLLASHSFQTQNYKPKVCLQSWLQFR